MKKSILGILIVLVAAFASCKKDVSLDEQRARTQGDLQYTIQIDSLVEVWGTDTVRFDFTKSEEIHSKWMFDFWWGDAAGNTILNGTLREASGYGVRFSPLDPNQPNGPQVLLPFTWYMEQATNRIIANIGGNRAEVTIKDGNVLLHQIKGPRSNEVERWYKGRQVTNGLFMKGNGAKRVG